jgi:RNA polymerase sigma-70 factor (ECF subfamily)
MDGINTFCIARMPSVRHAAPIVFILLMARAVAGRAATRERDLLDRLARGDPRALKALFEAYGPQTMAVAQRILRSPAEAEEVVQDTFVEVWKRSGEYDASRGGVLPWVLTIARTRAIDRLRSRDSASRTVAQATNQPEPPKGPSPLELVEQRQARERVAAALAELPGEQRAALELAYFEGLTHREIAERTSTPLGTVKTRVRLALEKLAGTLAEVSQGADPEDGS